MGCDSVQDAGLDVAHISRYEITYTHSFHTYISAWTRSSFLHDFPYDYVFLREILISEFALASDHVLLFQRRLPPDTPSDGALRLRQAYESFFFRFSASFL